MLRDEIDDAKRLVTTDTVQITVGEIANMYSSGELNIVPEFQRLFRWSTDRKANFIESILIGIPIPPAFAYEDADGQWELIDGLQRVSTVLEFMGLLKDPDTNEPTRSRLVSTKYLPSLDGVVWSKNESDDVELEKSLQLFFRRHRFDFQVLKYPSNPKTKFDLFQRLNRGGAYANEQEVRTCSMVMTDPNFTQKLREFAAQDDFKKIFRITEDQRKNQKDLEYAVRLIVHINKDFPKGRDVQWFLDQAILDIMLSSERNKTLKNAQWSVEKLYKVLGERALIPPNEAPDGFASRFSLRALEGIVVGIARNKKSILAHLDEDNFIREKVSSFWQQPEVSEMSTAGLRGSVRLQRTIPFGSKWFDPE